VPATATSLAPDQASSAVVPVGTITAIDGRRRAPSGMGSAVVRTQG
jgi:hypothetical protein